MVVARLVGRRRHRQRGCRLASVSELEDVGGFGTELRAAREQVRRLGRHIDVAIEARRRAHGPGSARPQHVARGRLPAKTNRRKPLGAGVVVVLDPGADRRVPIVAELDRVLDIGVGPRLVEVRRQHRQIRRAGRDAIGAVAQLASPDQRMGVAHRRGVTQLQVEDLLPIGELGRVVAIRQVVDELGGQRGAARELVGPDGVEVGAARRDRTQGERHPGDDDRARLRLALAAGVGGAVQRQRIGIVLPIRAESDLRETRRVVDRGAVARLGMRLFGITREHAEVAVGAAHRPRAAAPAQRRLAFARAARRRREPALRIVCRLGDHVDDAIDGVDTPYRTAGAADHLDPLDVLERQVLHVPEHAREQWRVDGATVDQHEELVRRGSVEPPRADRVAVGAGAGDLEIGREPQDFRQARGARAAHIVGGDDEDRRHGPGKRFGTPGQRRDLHVRQLLQRHVGQRLRRDIARLRRERRSRDADDAGGKHEFRHGMLRHTWLLNCFFACPGRHPVKHCEPEYGLVCRIRATSMHAASTSFVDAATVQRPPRCPGRLAQDAKLDGQRLVRAFRNRPRCRLPGKKAKSP